MGNLYCTSVTGATDGVTKDSDGRLIGYQRISGSALIYRNYSGYAKLKRGKHRRCLRMGIHSILWKTHAMEFTKIGRRPMKQRHLRRIKKENSNTVELEEGTYYVKEKKAPKGYRLDANGLSCDCCFRPDCFCKREGCAGVLGYGTYSCKRLIRNIKRENHMGQEVWRVPNLPYVIMQAYMIEVTLPKTPDRTWVLKSKKEKDRYESRLNKDYQISGDDFLLCRRWKDSGTSAWNDQY